PFNIIKVNTTKSQYWQLKVFFFKQKTAYEIGLGIPAEPLFRSILAQLEKLLLCERSQSKSFSSCARIGRIFSFSASSPLRFNSRSEERRVGKECTYRRSGYC